MFCAVGQNQSNNWYQHWIAVFCACQTYGLLMLWAKVTKFAAVCAMHSRVLLLLFLLPHPSLLRELCTGRSDCVDEAVESLKVLSTNIANYLTQDRRIAKQSKTMGKKIVNVMSVAYIIFSLFVIFYNTWNFFWCKVIEQQCLRFQAG